MLVKWKPGWYELDQSIVVGDRDLFYLSEDDRYFSHALLTSRGREHEVRAEILRITHPDLGEIRGAIAIGLDYSIYLSDGTELLVEAEETPGMLYDPRYTVSDWTFDVEINIIEDDEPISIDRKARIRKYKALLDLSEALWDR